MFNLRNEKGEGPKKPPMYPHGLQSISCNSFSLDIASKTMGGTFSYPKCAFRAVVPEVIDFSCGGEYNDISVSVFPIPHTTISFSSAGDFTLSYVNDIAGIDIKQDSIECFLRNKFGEVDVSVGAVIGPQSLLSVLYSKNDLKFGGALPLDDQNDENSSTNMSFSKSWGRWYVGCDMYLFRTYPEQTTAHLEALYRIKKRFRVYCSVKKNLASPLRLHTYSKLRLGPVWLKALYRTGDNSREIKGCLEIDAAKDTKVLLRMEKRSSSDSYKELRYELTVGHATSDAEVNVSVSLYGRKNIGFCIGYYQFQ